MTYKIAILGDFNPFYSTHHALNDSIRDARNVFKTDIQFDWISTETPDVNVALKNIYCGLWIAPGSPYKNMDNVLYAIKFARENNIPSFGNCGGFQHMIIEFARNVCGIKNADHEEINPDSSDLLISKLSCSLVEKEEDLKITDKNSILFDVIKKEEFKGRYFCSYGINDKYTDTLKSNGLKLTAASSDGEVRAFELKSHPFFVGTLFQPALTSTADEPNPLIVEFIKQSTKQS
jgi:CTP synthase (UTP-ammonia lyase)